LLILGSGSKARLAILVRLGIVPDKIISPNVDETPLRKELPRDYVSRISEDKNNFIQAERACFVITADTIVSLGTRIMGKPKDVTEAETFLRRMSGRRHKVITGVCIGHNGKTYKRLVETRLKMKVLSEFEISAFLKSNEWKGRAGGYGLQGSASYFFPFISGSYTNAVGLPVTELVSLLIGLGYQLPKTFMMGDVLN